MDMLFLFSEYLPYVLGGILIVLGLLAAIRILRKANKGETVHIEPVGVFQDLPDTVTGMETVEDKKEDCF